MTLGFLEPDPDDTGVGKWYGFFDMDFHATFPLGEVAFFVEKGR